MTACSYVQILAVPVELLVAVPAKALRQELLLHLLFVGLAGRVAGLAVVVDRTRLLAGKLALIWYRLPTDVKPKAKHRNRTIIHVLLHHVDLTCTVVRVNCC